MIEIVWICHHGVPKHFSADQEFCKPFQKAYLSGLGVEVQQRPSRSLHKNGIAEWNNDVFKTIVNRLEKENSVASTAILVARSSLLTKLFKGSSILSPF